MPLMSEQHRLMLAAATEELARRESVKFGKDVGPARKIELYRGLLNHDTDGLLAIVPNFQMPQPGPKPTPGATQSEVLSWLEQHSPNAGAVEKLNAVRTMVGKPLPVHVPEKTAADREAERQEVRERRARELAAERAKLK